MESSRKQKSQSETDALENTRQKELKEWDAKLKQRQKDAEKL